MIEILAKKCCNCQELLPIGCFSQNTSCWDGVQPACRRCERARHRSNRATGCPNKNQPEHGLRAAIRGAQNDQCALTAEPLKGKGHLDHDHQTGTIRGLVMPRANALIGAHEGGSIWSPQIAEYLSRYEEAPHEEA